jgi:hypothetical protein
VRRTVSPEFLKYGGEGGILRIECTALYRLTRPCSGTAKKALIGIQHSTRSSRRVLKANSREECSTGTRLLRSSGILSLGHRFVFHCITPQNPERRSGSLTILRWLPLSTRARVRIHLKSGARVSTRALKSVQELVGGKKSRPRLRLAIGRKSWMGSLEEYFCHHPFVFVIEKMAVKN